MADDLVLPNLREALRKEGWNLRPRAMRLESDDYLYLIDVEAEKGGRKICVEVKSWLNTFNTDWYMAFGQYLSYQEAITEERLPYTLYLAVPKDTYAEHFTNRHIDKLVTKNNIRLIIFDVNTNTILLWQ
jgi:hypothetical protein